MDLTPKQQTSEAIRQAQTILVTTGQHPSVDQVAAVISLAAILQRFGKKVSAVISDSLPQSVNLLDAGVIEKNLGGIRDFILKLDSTKAQAEKLRYEMVDGKLQIYVTPQRGSFAPSDVTFGYGDPQLTYDIAIVLGVPTRARIDKVYDQNMALFERIPILNFDFHRSNENYGAVNLIEPNASSLCEMLVALSESLQSGIIDAEIATALLMGIVASTDRFTAAHTTSKSLTVAAQMMAAGAKQQAVVRALYRDGKGSQNSDNRSGDRAERGNRQQPANDAARRPQAEMVANRGPVAPPRADGAQPHAAARAATAEREAQIIDPGHIELSGPSNEPMSEPMAAQPQVPTPSSAELRPPVVPMSDFAATSEPYGGRVVMDGGEPEHGGV